MRLRPAVCLQPYPFFAALPAFRHNAAAGIQPHEKPLKWSVSVPFRGSHFPDVNLRLLFPLLQNHFTCPATDVFAILQHRFAVDIDVDDSARFGVRFLLINRNVLQIDHG